MNFAVIFAGGVGVRMNSKDTPKQFLEIDGKPIIIHTLECFDKNEEIDGIVLSCVESHIEYMTSLLTKFGIKKVMKVVKGGETCQQSIFNGLNEIVKARGLNDSDIVLIHDGVRPILEKDLIRNNIDCVKQNGNAITVCKAIETVVLLDENSMVDRVMDRNRCNMAKAPQTFYVKDIYEKHLSAQKEGKLNFIDSATMMQYYGEKLHTVESSTENIKVTMPIDYHILKVILESRENNE